MTKTANYIYSPAQLGHRTLSMAQRYAHLCPDQMKRIASLDAPKARGEGAGDRPGAKGLTQPEA